MIVAGTVALHRRLLSFAHVLHLPVLAYIAWGLGLAIAAVQLVLSWRCKPCTLQALPLKVAVIIPCYNEDPAFLARVLDSLRLQTRRPDEIIVDG